MHEITVEIDFPASHALTIAGVREKEHSHQWRVSATVASEELDSDGLVCDFHALQGLLERIVAPWRGRSLNTAPPFEGVNPTAERVAQALHEALQQALPAVASPAVRVVSVAVTEAPGCQAVHRPSAPYSQGKANLPASRCSAQEA